MMTLRRRLLLLLLPALALLMLLGALADYWVTTATTRAAYDRALISTARSAAQFIDAHGSTPEAWAAGISQVIAEAQADSASDTHTTTAPLLYAVSDAAGHLMSGSQALHAALAAAGSLGSASTVRDLRVNGAMLRVVTLSLPPRASASGGARVSIAEPHARRAHTQQVMLFGKLMVDFAEMDLTLLAIWFAVYFGLRPLRQLEARAEQQGSQRLQRFDETQVPGELRSLVVGFNRVLELLQDAASAQRRFVADAAHQMRTPVAGLLAQIELLMHDPRATSVRSELATLQRGTQSLARSANQLLTLARTEPVSALQAEPQPVPLADLIHELIERHLDRADRAGIDLGVETEPIAVMGEQRLLQDLIENLLDNALKYTPSGGHVTARCGLLRGHPCVEVEDDGPGIPAAERQRVRERFYRRPGAPGIGTGLGLAIVDEIARLHGADLSILDGAQSRGVRMQVLFPRAALTDITPESVTRLAV
jgi:two-component system sensor histidine kinase TctE